MNYLDTEFTLATIGQIITIFVIANSLLSLSITQTMGRPAITRWRSKLWWILLILWLSVFLPLIEISTGFNQIKVDTIVINNPLTKLAILSWFISIIWMLIITNKIFTLDLIKFNKSKLLKREVSSHRPSKQADKESSKQADSVFEHNEERKWGLDSINHILKQDTKPVYFPIIINGDETSRPWELLSRFVISGLTYNNYHKPGAVFFTFTRPFPEILEGLKRWYGKLVIENEKDDKHDIIGSNSIDWKNLVVIDCYTQFAKRYDDYHHGKVVNYYTLFRKPHYECEVSFADANNPHDMNKKYERALALLQKKGCRNIRVVYDALSDFLTFTDQQLTSQYLKNNGTDSLDDITYVQDDQIK
jgi:hypothetical protein